MQKIILDENNRTKRKRLKWNARNMARANDIKQILDEMHEYQPLTERQIYYRLISSKLTRQGHWHKYGNPEYDSVDIYKAIGRLLKWMRIDDMIPWTAIADEHRALTGKVGFENPYEFIDSELDNFLDGYRRCLAHRQEYYIEVWIEKAALFHIVRPVVEKYCRRLLCCKGYNSVTFQADFYNRAAEALQYGQKPVVLYFGDWDPSGVDMFNAGIQTMVEELGLVQTDFYRCGINPEHFHLLQADPVPLKPSDSRTKKFIKKHGTTAYELDAFHPKDLQYLVEESIQAFTDLEAIADDLYQEENDLDYLNSIKNEVRQVVIDKL